MRKTDLLGTIAILLFAISMSAFPVAAVTNGQPDAAHTYVGLVLFYDNTMTPLWRCSGTLFAPTVLVTAGHCTTTTYSAQVWFDQTVVYDTTFHGGSCLVGGPYTGYPCVGGVTGTPHTHPGYTNPYGPGLVRFDTHDVGVVVLDTPVTNLGYGDLPSQGQADTLAMNTGITLVGYGVSIELRGHGQPVWTGPRARMYAPTLLIASNDAISAEYIKLTANPAQGKGGTCFGDSGGPDFIAGTNTFIAVNSFVTNGNCAGVTYSNRIDTDYALAFIISFLPT